MKTTVLILNNHTHPGQILTKSFKKAGKTVVTVGTDESSDLHWNPRSPLSIQTLIHQIPEKTSAINEILIPLAIPSFSGTLDSLDTPSLEESVDTLIKGTILGCRELFNRPLPRGDHFTVTFFLIQPEENHPLSAALTGALKGFAQELTMTQETRDFGIRGFETRSAFLGEATEMLIRLLDEKGSKLDGKWTRLQEKGGLFGIGKLR